MRDDDARTLIEDALAGVVVVVCPTCRGTGEIGLDDACCECPRCNGSGQSTAGPRPPLGRFG